MATNFTRHPSSIVGTAISVYGSIQVQRHQSIKRLEQTAGATRDWIKAAAESRKAQLRIAGVKPAHDNQDGKQPAKKKPKVEGTLPTDTIDFVYSLRVKELSCMLKDRGLDVNGLKKDLQQKLLDALEIEYQQQQKQQDQERQNDKIQEQQDQEHQNDKIHEPTENSEAIDQPAKAVDKVVQMDIEKLDACMDIEPKPEEEEKELIDGECIPGDLGSKPMEEETKLVDDECISMDVGPKPVEEEIEEETELNDQPKLNLVVAPSSSPQRKSRPSPLKMVKTSFQSALRAISPMKSRISANASPMKSRVSANATSSVNILIQKIESSKNLNVPTREEHTVASASVTASVVTSSTRDDESQSKAEFNESTNLGPSASSRMLAGSVHVATTASGDAVLSSTDMSGAKAQNKKTTQSTLEARRARIAEMRSKSKPIMTSTSSITTVPTIGKLPSTATSFAKDEKKNLLAAQMREKAQARLQADPPAEEFKARLQADPPAKEFNSAKENSPNKSIDENSTESSTLYGDKQASPNAKATQELFPKPASKATGGGTSAQKLWKHVASAQVHAQSKKDAGHQAASSPPVGEATAEPNNAKAAEQPPTVIPRPGILSDLTKQKSDGSRMLSPPAAAVKSHSSPVVSPMDTYEMSDRDQSDSDSEDEEYNNKPKKRIPDWAQKSKLVPALEHQFGKRLHDPDQIFGEVQTCDLQEIFNQKKARYQRRTSSGNWTKDRVTAAEKLAYKRGFDIAGDA